MKHLEKKLEKETDMIKRDKILNEMKEVYEVRSLIIFYFSLYNNLKEQKKKENLFFLNDVENLFSESNDGDFSVWSNRLWLY